MKQLFALLLAAILLLSCSCGDVANETEPSEEITDTPATESETVDDTGMRIPEETLSLPPREPVVLAEEMQEKLGTFVPDAWKTRVEQLAFGDEDTFLFAVQTDTHFSIANNDSAANNVKALSHFAPLDFIANTGDLVKGYKEINENTPENTRNSMKELVRRYTEDVNCPVLLTFGNHDTNQIWSKEHGAATDQLTRADHYEMVTSKLKEVNNDKLIGVGEGAMVTDGESNYYYVDFHHDRIRVIMLNSTDGDYSTEFASLSTISNEQAEWFRNEALYTNYSVIVMIHIPLLKYFPGNQSWSVVNSHKITLAVNEFVAAGGDFIAYMYGHTHTQSHLVDRDGRLHVSFKSGANRAELVTVDTDTRRIITYGLGDVEDREFDY